MRGCFYDWYLRSLYLFNLVIDCRQTFVLSVVTTYNRLAYAIKMPAFLLLQ